MTNLHGIVEPVVWHLESERQQKIDGVGAKMRTLALRYFSTTLATRAALLVIPSNWREFHIDFGGC
jgi:hypothetical protein